MSLGLSRVASLALLVAIQIFPAAAADDVSVERLVTCKDSWLDWKNTNAPELTVFAKHFQADFVQQEDQAFFVPKASETIDGFKVLRLFPESVGMGVGFSLFVAAPFDQAKARFEEATGKPLKHCEVSDGMRTCARELGEKRTFMLMAEDNAKSSESLAGCYYFYEK